MIGKLTGLVDSVAAEHAIIDVGGVGYLVSCPSSTLSRLETGKPVSLMIETRITDETIRLYGFVSGEEREWFRLLQTVQNVGARVALNVLSTLSPRELERALALGDKAAIGPKLATRIATELKDKAPAMMARGAGGEMIEISAPKMAGPAADALSALVKLGYSQAQAAEAVARATRDLGEGSPAPALIREALRSMARA
jgi:Holliday junction DNA helicase RuvA